MAEQLDHPFNDILEAVDKLIAGNPNVDTYQKFTCENCKNRLTMEEPNTFYTAGICDKCGHTTDIKKNGCNFMALARLK
jgi:PHP family Zn ribbon phosphoesterase